MARNMVLRADQQTVFVYGIMPPMRYRALFRSRPACVIVAGLALGLSAAYGWWPVAIFGIILTLQLLEHTRSYRQALVLALAIGMIRSIIVVGWFWSVYPIDWMGITSRNLQVALVGFYWLYVAMSVALGYPFLALTVRYLRQRPQSWRLLLIPITWVLADAFGALAFSILMYGTGARIGFDFSFGYIGYAAVTHSLLFQLARIGGVWTLSFGVVFVAVLLQIWWQTQRRFAIALVLTLVVFSAPFWIAHQTVPVTQTVALIDTQFPSDSNHLDFSFREGQVAGAVQAALTTDADTIVLPEDSRFTLNFTDPTAALQFITKYAHKPVVVIDSARVPVGNHVVLRAFVYDTRAQTYYTFDKQYLVPQGELEPYITRFLVQHLPLSQSARDIVQNMVYEPGINQSTVALPRYVPTVLFCFESVTPWGVQDAIAGRSTVPFVAHVVSHDWFHGQPTLLNRQLDAMLRVQAAWNHLPIYLAGNDAPVERYLSNGQISRPIPTLSTPYWSITIVPKS